MVYSYSDDKDARYSPLYEKIFEVIKEKILMGILKPGDPLVEVKLAEELGVSRTPIREALRQLERITLYNHIQVEVGLTQQEVSHHTTDKIDTLFQLGCLFAEIPHKLQNVLRKILA